MLEPYRLSRPVHAGNASVDGSVAGGGKWLA